MAKPLPYKRSASGGDYLCARDDAALPDGVLVQGQYSGNNLVGVRAIHVGKPTQVAHSCGTVTALTSKWVGQSDQVMVEG